MSDANTVSDESIVKLVRSKDKQQYQEIIRRYQASLLRYANSLVGDEHKSADVVQEAFVKAYINLNGFDTKKKFSSWIYRIVHNEAMNAMTRREKSVRMNDTVEFDSGIDLEDTMLRQELVHHAQTCLGQMPVQYREPLALFYLEEKSYEDISDILRIPIGTVGTRINRAKSMMKKLCQRK